MRNPSTFAIACLLGAVIATGVAAPVHAAPGVALSKTNGSPGDVVRLTIADARSVVDLLPLAVQLRAVPTFADWPCDFAGSRFLGFLRRAANGEVALAFTVPWVQAGLYQLVGAGKDRSCVPLDGTGQAVEFAVSPQVAVRLPVAELVASNGRVGPATPGCGSWRINGSDGVDDCGPYEYLPLAMPATRLPSASTIAFGISQNWRYGPWRLTAISEDAITPGVNPPSGEREIAHGAGGSRTIRARLPAGSGTWRLFLTYVATRGVHRVTIDRPSVFAVDLGGLPDTSTESATNHRDGTRPPVGPPSAIEFLLIGLVITLVIAPVRSRRRRLAARAIESSLRER